MVLVRWESSNQRVISLSFETHHSDPWAHQSFLAQLQCLQMQATDALLTRCMTHTLLTPQCTGENAAHNLHARISILQMSICTNYKMVLSHNALAMVHWEDDSHSMQSQWFFMQKHHSLWHTEDHFKGSLVELFDNGAISSVIQTTNGSHVLSSRPRTDVRPKGKDTRSNAEHKVERKRWVPTPCSIAML